MPRACIPIRQVALLTSTVGLMTAALTLGSGGLAPAAEDFFRSMGVHRPASPSPAPDLALPTPEGRTVDIKEFTGKVVLLGFFTTT